MPKFHEVIRNRRRQLQRSQREVARAVGIQSADFISLVEKGQRRIDLDRIPALAAVLDLDVHQLCRQALALSAPRMAEALFGAEVQE